MGKIDDLYITVPSFFKCPISLDIMKSPVSLSTGVTYDRVSIQQWLESGNNTCPATMQVLDSKEFVPNHTLQRLIQIWCNNNHLSHFRSNLNPKFQSISCAVVTDLIKQLVEKEHAAGFGIMFEIFVKILCFATESDDNTKFLANDEKFIDYLVKFLCSKGPDLKPDLLEAVLKIFHLIITKGKKILNPSSCDSISTTLVRILRTRGSESESGSRVAAAGIIETFAQNPELKKQVFEHHELVFELLQVLKHREIKQDEIQAILSCLISLSSARTNKRKLIRAGGVKIIVDLMSNINNKNLTIELLVTQLEMLVGCTEGRAAIIDDPNCLQMIINKVMKVSKSTNEHCIAILWSMCYLFRDQRAKEGVMRSNGGLTKILLLMQSDCSPAVKKMCCDLLRIFRVNSKSCLSSYDTKTTHIMPF
ncbi:unnamed protein product [Amaranthus hypochondriacus]